MHVCILVLLIGMQYSSNYFHCSGKICAHNSFFSFCSSNKLLQQLKSQLNQIGRDNCNYPCYAFFLETRMNQIGSRGQLQLSLLCIFLRNNFAMILAVYPAFYFFPFWYVNCNNLSCSAAVVIYAITA